MLELSMGWSPRTYLQAELHISTSKIVAIRCCNCFRAAEDTSACLLCCRLQLSCVLAETRGLPPEDRRLAGHILRSYLHTKQVISYELLLIRRQAAKLLQYSFLDAAMEELSMYHCANTSC